MFNQIGLPGIILIAVVVLILFGRGKISSLMGEVGKGITSFKKGISEGKQELDKTHEEVSEKVKDITPEKDKGWKQKMFDLGWQELFVIGTVTLIVVGPKDLPKLLNRAGKIFGKIKQISREFYDQINETAEIEEINDLKNNLSKHTSLDSYIEDPNIGIKKRNSSKASNKK